MHAHEQVVAGERLIDQASRDPATDQVVLHQRGNVDIRMLRPHGAVAHHVGEHQHVVPAGGRVAGGGGDLDFAEAVALVRDGSQQSGGQAIGLIDMRRPVGLGGEHHHVAPVELDGAGELLVAVLRVTHLG